MDRVGVMSADIQGSSGSGGLTFWGRGPSLWMESRSEDLPAPLLPFKTLLPKLGPSVPLFGSGCGSESTLSREHQEHELLVFPPGKGLRAL